MSLILNIETSSDICSVSLGRNGEVADVLESGEPRDHAAALTLLVDRILKKNRLETDDLDAVAVSEGPGSYTGLRIGVSTAKGLAYGLQIPLIAVSTLEALVAGALAVAGKEIHKSPESTWLCPMIDARRMEVYLAFFDISGKRQSKTEAVIVTPGSFGEVLKKRSLILFGTGSEKCKEVLTHPHVRFLDNVRPSAEYMAALSFKKFKKQIFADIAYFEPFYLKEFIATIPKNMLNTER